jgi:tetratricopeptide (TPR) repeat protein
MALTSLALTELQINSNDARQREKSIIMF